MFGSDAHRLPQHARVRTFATDQALPHPLVHQRLDRLAVELDVKPFGHSANLRAQRAIAVDHRHAIDRLIQIFDDMLRTDESHHLFGLDHERRLAGGVQVVKLVAFLPRVLAHQLVADTLFREDKPDLARKRAQGELEKLPHEGAALADGRGASSASDRSDRAYSRPPVRATSAPLSDRSSLPEGRAAWRSSGVRPAV